MLKVEYLSNNLSVEISPGARINWNSRCVPQWIYQQGVVNKLSNIVPASNETLCAIIIYVSSKKNVRKILVTKIAFRMLVDIKEGVV